MSIIADHLTNDEVLQILGERFRAHRLARNITVEVLAEHIGIDRKTILAFENGRDIRLKSMIAILRGIGMLGAFDGLLQDILPGGMAFSSRGTVRKKAYGKGRG